MSSNSSRASRFTVLDGEQLRKTLLGGCLIEAVDAARNIATVLGARPYTVSLVRTRWSGGARDDGVEEIASHEPILPTPQVGAIDNITGLIQPIGRGEVGTVRVWEISGAYTEDCLRGLGPKGEAIPEDESFYYEIGFPQADGTTIFRRFTLRSAPGYTADEVQWTVDLLRASDARDRETGDLGG